MTIEELDYEKELLYLVNGQPRYLSGATMFFTFPRYNFLIPNSTRRKITSHESDDAFTYFVVLVSSTLFVRTGSFRNDRFCRVYPRLYAPFRMFAKNASACPNKSRVATGPITTCGFGNSLQVQYLGKVQWLEQPFFSAKVLHTFMLGDCLQANLEVLYCLHGGSFALHFWLQKVNHANRMEECANHA